MVYLKKVLKLSVKVYVYLWFHIQETEAKDCELKSSLSYNMSSGSSRATE